MLPIVAIAVALVLLAPPVAVGLLSVGISLQPEVGGARAQDRHFAPPLRRP